MHTRGTCAHGTARLHDHEDQGGNTHNPITCDPKGGMYWTWLLHKVKKFPSKSNKYHHSKHVHHNLGLHCTFLPWGAIEYPALYGVEIGHQDKLDYQNRLF